jgi:hypothetical protein
VLNLVNTSLLLRVVEECAILARMDVLSDEEQQLIVEFKLGWHLVPYLVHTVQKL